MKFTAVFLLFVPALAQAAAVTLVPLPEALSAAPSARLLLASESARAGGPDFSAGAAAVLPAAATSFAGGQLFYALFNDFSDPASTRSFAIQRIRKTTRGFRASDDRQPVVSVEYLVEIFKTRDGAYKRADLHHGTYPLNGFYRREVLKELEVGTGELPGVAAGDPWPFEPGLLYRLVQDYSGDHAAYDSVRFDRSVSWSIEAVLGSDGRYELSAPALGVALGSGH